MDRETNVLLKDDTNSEVENSTSAVGRNLNVASPGHVYSRFDKHRFKALSDPMTDLMDETLLTFCNQSLGDVTTK